MATPHEIIATPEGGTALVRRLDRHDLSGLARVLPQRWMRLSASDWRAVYLGR